MTDVKALAQEWVNANTIYHAEPIVLGTLSPARAVPVKPTATEAFIAGFKLAQSLQEQVQQLTENKKV